MIFENKIKCKKCGEVIVSKHRHDFKMCKCNACGVDGGFTYLRRIGDSEDWEEQSTTKVFDWETSMDKLYDDIFYYTDSDGMVTVKKDDLRKVLSALDEYSLAAARYLWMLKNGESL